jgi:endonuclease YncB( thermonuclease family)
MMGFSRRVDTRSTWRRAITILWLALTASPAFSGEISGTPRIVDGDTVVIGQTKIRLFGIDAPETDQVCLDAKGQKWACGIAARDELIEYSNGQT